MQTTESIWTTKSTWEFRDESSTVFGNVTSPSTRWGNRPKATASRGRVLLELSTREGMFRVVLAGTNSSHFISALALEQLAADEPVTLMRSGNKRGFSRVRSSSTPAHGTIDGDWKLPENRPLDAFCHGEKTPWRTISLQSGGRSVIVARYLEQPQSLWAQYLERSLGKGFRTGEAVLSSDLPEAPHLLPLLLFTFEVLKLVNWKPGGR